MYIEPVYDDIEMVHIPITDVRKDRPRPNRHNRHVKPTNTQTDRHTDIQTNRQNIQPTDMQTYGTRPVNAYQESFVIENRATTVSSAGPANENDEQYKFGNLLGFFQSMDRKPSDV